MKRTLLLFVTASCWSTMVHAQDIKEKEVSRIISTLAADDMQGRRPGTPGIEKAAQFISSEFQKAGLQPLAGEKNFRQQFAKYSLKVTQTRLQINGQERNWPVIPVGKATSIRWEKDTSYNVVHVKDLNTLLPLLRQGNKREKNTLVWLDPALEGYLGGLNASFAERFHDRPEDVQSTGDAQPQLLMVLEKEPVADSLPWSVSLTREVVSQPFTNIAGMIKGSKKPDEYVVFSGHYDHLGILPAVAGDSIANGADDDASGTTAVIMLAKHFKQSRPARSIIFVAFTAEESGGYGSGYFSEKQDPDKVVAMFNIEMIGKESKFGKNSAFITGFEKSDFGTILQRNLKGSAFHFYPDPYPEQNLFYRSDNATLAKLGVPAHTISTTQIDKDKLYHTVNDELESLDVTNITDIIKAIATSAKTIIGGTDTPTRIDPMKE
ncbi:M20/M25/M40 family metallo-hydrolase [Chitinophaga nivalis]|uniref:M20/M25/M40 family metallo-hydrolase n=1 Tax=Chitinophaga nivalis TaxID=2991709 RepID=A0ABT3IWT5_9BACT|nr:M20/M25/M40 family metallo-hydrolase [Chitinophaga nivalis]MCW3461895.1 M20/M25/M40 family metallo-hydrolase [Chitinophaga nivalis]MCW3488414.1 M20/M25/M40 family metallo-hydrolase [Chitinophaga nivalis]